MRFTCADCVTWWTTSHDGGALEPLFMGKFALSHLVVLEQLIEEGWVRPPDLLPRWFTVPAALATAAMPRAPRRPSLPRGSPHDPPDRASPASLRHQRSAIENRVEDAQLRKTAPSLPQASTRGRDRDRSRASVPMNAPPIRIGFVINDMATEKNNYTTIRLARTAINRGHDVALIGLGGFIYDIDGSICANAHRAAQGQVQGRRCAACRPAGRRCRAWSGSPSTSWTC